MKESIDIQVEEPCWLTAAFEQQSAVWADDDFGKKYRQQQFTQFKVRGFPSRREEAWKYTDLTFMQNNPFHWPLPSTAALLGNEELQALVKERAQNNFLLVFVNGHYAPLFSSHSAFGEGVILDNLQAALQRHAALIRAYFLKEIDTKRHPFVSLNAALFSDGIFLYLPRGLVLEKPLHVLSLAYGQTGFMMHPRHLFILESDSQLCFTEEYHSIDADHYLTNASLDFFVGRGANLVYNKVQNEAENARHVAHLFFHQKQNSKVKAVSFTRGGQLSRQELVVNLQEQQAACCLKGFYSVDRDAQQSDHAIYIDHQAPQTQSSIDYRGVLAEASRAIFAAKVQVRSAAQKTKSEQINRNLLLSKLAEVDIKPELEIDAEEVNCRHGATVGQIDEESLFYLGTRGIDRQLATTILLQAFMEEVLREVSLPWLRHYLHEQWGRQLAKL
ncbi:MAG TPA: Fe-S cluster assembly protein SufD [Gammaproteobacteria bacterium]|nr:Fe-S cluster assembly protein SufD [Gammaproteobacteria bacterium]